MGSAEPENLVESLTAGAAGAAGPVLVEFIVYSLSIGRKSTIAVGAFAANQ
jgi:hypothetical protein